jgi:hypothetical protein
MAKRQHQDQSGRTPGKRVALYLRVSTDRKQTITNQRRELLEVAHYGWQIVGEFKRKLPRQVDTAKLDSAGMSGLGRKISGGTRPRLSWGRSVL